MNDINFVVGDFVTQIQTQMHTHKNKVSDTSYFSSVQNLKEKIYDIDFGYYDYDDIVAIFIELELELKLCQNFDQSNYLSQICQQTILIQNKYKQYIDDSITRIENWVTQHKPCYSKLFSNKKVIFTILSNRHLNNYYNYNDLISSHILIYDLDILTIAINSGFIDTCGNNLLQIILSNHLNDRIINLLDKIYIAKIIIHNLNFEEKNSIDMCDIVNNGHISVKIKSKNDILKIKNHLEQSNIELNDLRLDSPKLMIKKFISDCDKICTNIDPRVNYATIDKIINKIKYFLKKVNYYDDITTLAIIAICIVGNNISHRHIIQIINSITEDIPINVDITNSKLLDVHTFIFEEFFSSVDLHNVIHYEYCTLILSKLSAKAIRSYIQIIMYKHDICYSKTLLEKYEEIVKNIIADSLIELFISVPADISCKLLVIIITMNYIDYIDNVVQILKKNILNINGKLLQQINTWINVNFANKELTNLEKLSASDIILKFSTNVDLLLQLVKSRNNFVADKISDNEFVLNHLHRVLEPKIFFEIINGIIITNNINYRQICLASPASSQQSLSIKINTTDPMFYIEFGKLMSDTLTKQIY
jgi:hypothetical protein